MGRGESKHELLILFDRLGFEPKRLLFYLKERGENYSYYTLKKYFKYYATAKMIATSIMQKTPIGLKGEKK